VIIADHKIEYPELLGIDLLVALSDEAAHHYAPLLKWDGVFIYDSGEVPDPPPVGGATFGAPFARLALEVTGRAQTTNVLALGATVGLTGVVGADSVAKAATSMVPPGSAALNLRALEHGLSMPPEAWVK
jgi:Pyruvate/2-oxoacid:ferredoxin oxidoreductase gamma subunit